MDEISHGSGESKEPDEVPNHETTKAMESPWSDWIFALENLLDKSRKISVSVLPVELKDGKVKDNGKTLEHGGVFDDHSIQSRNSVCQIDEAVKDKWINALNRWDCIELMKQLGKNPCLLAIKSGRENDTVMHVAARQGCLKLIVHILSLFMDSSGSYKQFVHDDKKIFIVEFLQEYNVNQVTAVDLLWFVMGGYFMYEFWACIARGWSCHRMSLPTLATLQDEVFNSLFQDELGKYRQFFQTTPYTTTPILSDRCRNRDFVLEVLSRHKEKFGDKDLVEDRNYIFVAKCEELQFHYGCKNFWRFEDYVKAVIGDCVEEGHHVVKYLFQYRNAQGLTPLHVASSYLSLEELWDLIPKGEEYKDCLNALDGRGWTVLHCEAAFGDTSCVRPLLEDARTDVNARVNNDGDEYGATALHLAVLHNHSQIVRMLLEREDVNVNAVFKREIVPLGCLDLEILDRDNLSYWTPLQLAAMMGRHDIVKLLLQHSKIEDKGIKKRNNGWWKWAPQSDNSHHEGHLQSAISAIHLAAAFKEPETLRVFVSNPKCDLLVTFQGCTSLHFAVDASPLSMKSYAEFFTQGNGRIIKREDFVFESQLTDYIKAKGKEKSIPSDKERETCINILVQGGVDVWQVNDKNNLPEPGPEASIEARHFWQQKLQNEIQDAKKNLNDAGNAISVVSALVATASYVGPLQPPLGLDSNSVQATYLSIRVFMVANSLSFYMAIASIIFAVVPSLPMPQEGIYEEWRRSRQTIIIAIHLLLLAVVGVLISFAAASNVVMFEEYSWQHEGLTFYPALLGGLVCLVAILLFYLRLFRLTFDKNVRIRHIYQYVFRARQTKKVKPN